MWQIEIYWHGTWVVVARDFKSKDEAEWVIAGWKQHNECFGDPFRAALVPEPRNN